MKCVKHFILYTGLILVFGGLIFFLLHNAQWFDHFSIMVWMALLTTMMTNPVLNRIEKIKINHTFQAPVITDIS